MCRRSLRSFSAHFTPSVLAPDVLGSARGRTPRSRCVQVQAAAHACCSESAWIPLAGLLVKHMSTYSGCLGRTKCGGRAQFFFNVFFCFSISSCVNVSLLCSCTLRQSQPLKRVSVQKNTCFESLFRFRNHTSVSLRWLELYPWTSCPASA